MWGFDDAAGGDLAPAFASSERKARAGLPARAFGIYSVVFAGVDDGVVGPGGNEWRGTGGDGDQEAANDADLQANREIRDVARNEEHGQCRREEAQRAVGGLANGTGAKDYPPRSGRREHEAEAGNGLAKVEQTEIAERLGPGGGGALIFVRR